MSTERGDFMILPNKWGQGQIFAFSALDGISLHGSDFVGTLSSDRIGIIFHTKTKRELFIANIENTALDFETLVMGNVIKNPDPHFTAVLSDMICLDTAFGTDRIIYAERHLIIGEIPCGQILVNTDRPVQIKKSDGIQLHDTGDGEFTALYALENKFSFAYGASEEAALALAKKGMSLNVAAEAKKKLKLYESFSLAEDCPDAMLFSKCLSVMKSQLYSSEGKFRHTWSTPDRLPHKNLWLWDSVFHAIGFRNINPALAEDLISALFDVAHEDGFIAHMSLPHMSSEITQPPVIAFGSYLVYEKSKSKNFLKNVFEYNGRFLKWCDRNRRLTERKLYSWHVSEDIHCRCDESGMDNSPRFDTKNPLYAIDFSCYMANEMRFMAKIADELGLANEAVYYSAEFEKIKSAINELLWDSEDGFYYDYDLKEQRLHKVAAISSFLPLFAGVADENQAKALYLHLKNPDEFYTAVPIPCISKKDKTFGSDMWRGPMWINYNYMLSHALKTYGFSELAEEIIDKTLKTVNYWYNITGTVFEFYDSTNKLPPYAQMRKGEPFMPYMFDIKYQTIRDYGWSSTLTFDLLCHKYGK